MSNPNSLTVTMPNHAGTVSLASGSAITRNTLRVGDIELSEEFMARIEAAVEFIERFAAENDEARAVWTAIKTKKRILK